MLFLSPDIRSIEIAPSTGFVPPTPGSHLNVGVLIGDRPDFRSYSIVGPCANGVYRIAVKRLKDLRGGSAYMWTLAPGARVSVSVPANHFELSLGRPEYLLLAGGIGVTPIIPLPATRGRVSLPPLLDWPPGLSPLQLVTDR